MGLDAAIKTLQTLDQDELRKLHDRTLFLLDDPVQDENDFAELLYKAVVSVLNESYSVNAPPLHQLKRLGLHKKYTEALVELTPFLESITGTKVEKHAAYCLFVKLVVEHLSENRVLVSVKTVIQNLNKIPELFDQAFPGYLHAGILPWMIMTLTSQRP